MTTYACHGQHTHLVCVAVEEEQVEGNRRHQVDQEPTAKVVDGYPARIWDDLVGTADVRRSEVDQDVYYEGYVHWNEMRIRVFLWFEFLSKFEWNFYA